MTGGARRDAGHASELVATTFAYPGDLVDNDEYLRRCRFELGDPARLASETGIKTRRWCLPHENTATLVGGAVARLMVQHPGLCEEIDLVVAVSATTMAMAHPSDPDHPVFADLSSLVLRQLGRTTAVGIDLKAGACAGFLRGMQVVDGLLGHTDYRCALLVAAEQVSRFAVAATNRSSFCFLAADAAGAVVLRRRERPPAGARIGVVDHCGYTDVSKLDWVRMGDDAASLVVMGSKVATATVEMLVDCGRTLMRRNGIGPAGIDWLIPIQTHAGVLDQVVKALEWPREKLLWRGDVNGFSGSASIPSCLAEEIERGTIEKGQLILSLAAGAGMNAAGALYYY
jgi:3-oxoacyl-[acyl-carrier-protein] synthase-3